MRKDHLISALQALGISVPLTAVVAFAVGEFSWRIAIVAVILSAIIWIVTVARSPKAHDAPPPNPMPGIE